MEQSEIEDAAMFLLHLRTQRDQVGGLPGEFTPKSLEDAYDIQDTIHRFAGWPIGMLKVGCTSLAAQEALGIPHPGGGRIPAEGVFGSGSVVPRSFLASEPLLECEIAMRVGLNGVVDSVAPAIELVNARYSDTSRVSGPSIIADNLASCAAILGVPVSLAEVDDLDALDMTLHNNEGQIASGNAQALIEGPQGSIDWTLAHEASRGRNVVPGTWIITGTCSGLTPTRWGSSYTADFGLLGSVSFTLGD
ncbi:MAG: 2-keto-4-pentenoate hydratase [Paracrocinitomix sp.]|jgi:2-keto-4-pentenoate hydratase